MSETQGLSERLRTRLAAAARGEAEAHPLSMEAEQRLASALVAEARAGARKGRFQHSWIAAGLAAAAALAIALWPAQERSAVTASCGLPSEPVLAARGGASRLDLGQLGDIVGGPGAVLAVKSATTCELVVAVESGSVLVDVHKLAPARLVVTTPHGDVIVRGTQFAVDVGDELGVHLVTGRIELVDAADEAVLTAGHSLRHQRGRATRTYDLTERERAEVRSLGALRATFVGDARAQPRAPEVAAQPTPPVIVPALPSANDDFLARAEEARRRGASALARRFYEKATHAPSHDAEVALLRWARFELDLRRPAAASALLTRHRRVFPEGALAAEAAWLSVEVASARGDAAAARAQASALVRAHPGTPQAEAAAQLLSRP